jgi:hypothetical protein
MISRRSLLGEGTAAFVVSGPVFLWATARASRVEAATKVTQVMAGYQTSPKGEAKCATCGHFRAPSSCELVEGQISPDGWCKFYAKKG